MSCHFSLFDILTPTHELQNETTPNLVYFMAGEQNLKIRARKRGQVRDERELKRRTVFPTEQFDLRTLRREGRANDTARVTRNAHSTPLYGLQLV